MPLTTCLFNFSRDENMHKPPLLLVVASGKALVCNQVCELENTPTFFHGMLLFLQSMTGKLWLVADILSEINRVSLLL